MTKPFHQLFRESEAEYRPTEFPGIVSTTSVTDGGMTSLGGGFVKWIEDGAEISEVHQHDEVIIVLEGETKISTPDGQVTIGKGGSIIVRNGTPAVHTATAGTTTFYVILLRADERA
ncbi:MAG: hypothetical protein QM622_04025 [Microbacterium sp.]